VSFGQPYPVVGELTPYTDHHCRRFWGSFYTETVDGLAHVSGRRIDVLAVMSRFPGSGNFARFLLALMMNYDTVAFWEIINQDLPDVLKRRGFREVTEAIDGEVSPCMRWDRPGT
jgi:hypothetical protein